ncbi:MAG: glycosyltransferase family 2 protein [Candidatus Schekmanbacteria bacterium]|nr:glycosyltransferase family 2 protein [Candidatus Schekmanbacteria bacterium]
MWESQGLPSVTIVTVNHNGREHLRGFLACAAGVDYPADRLDLIVVDNASTDGSRSFVRAHAPGARLLENSANLGFAQPNNQAAAAARSDYLLLLNNDTRFSPSLVRELVAASGTSPRAVCVGARILSWDGERIDFAGARLSFAGLGFQEGHGDGAEAVRHERELRRIPFACGCAMLVRRQVFLDCGGFDEDYFAYYEDVDLGWRLWVLGYEVLYCPTAVVYHRQGGTASAFGAAWKRSLMERNAILTVIKNTEDGVLGATLPAALLLAIRRAALDCQVGLQPLASVCRPARGGWRCAWQYLTCRLSLLLAAVRTVGLRAGVRRIAARLRGPRRFSARQDGGADLGLAAFAGLDRVVELLPRAFAKRALIQAARRRSDEEVWSLVGDPLHPASHRPAYRVAQEAAAQSFDLARLLSGAGGAGPDAAG